MRSKPEGGKLVIMQNAEKLSNVQRMMNNLVKVNAITSDFIFRKRVQEQRVHIVINQKPSDPS